MNLLSYIVWNPDLEAFHLGPISVRWYGLMWLIGFVLGYFIVKRLYKEQKIKDELFDPLFIYCFFGRCSFGPLYLLPARGFSHLLERHRGDDFPHPHRQRW